MFTKPVGVTDLATLAAQAAQAAFRGAETGTTTIEVTHLSPKAAVLADASKVEQAIQHVLLTLSALTDGKATLHLQTSLEDAHAVIAISSGRASAPVDPTRLSARLYAARQIVQDQGGELWIDRTVGATAACRITLPAASSTGKSR